MKSKIIKKILDYAREHEIFDLAITKSAGHHILLANNGLKSHELKIPIHLEKDLGLAFRELTALASSDLISNAYLKTAEAAFHLSIIPENDGEKIIIKINNKDKKLLTLPRLGLGRSERQLIEKILNKRRGLIIVGADDNQGKTTTLYALLQKINKEKRTCYALERYSELELDEVSRILSQGQKRLNDLSEIIKNNSEVIMIDDADDKLLSEAVIAARAGRLVLVGIKSDNVTTLSEKIQSLSQKDDLETLVIFQKLIKKNCPKCLKAYAISESEELITKYWPFEKKYKPKFFFTSQGCSKCHHLGTKGLIATFSLIKLNNQEVAVISTLASDILQKAANGLISISKFITKHRLSSIKKL
ncbi:MAG: ATPase, T2SS/T4P/T4SS family [Candidatus Falkowbacteria bacterium]